MNFLRCLGYEQYGAVLASAGFGTMPELTLITVGALRRLNIPEGHALRIVDCLKKIPPALPPSRPVHNDFQKLRKKRLAAPAPPARNGRLALPPPPPAR